MSEFETTKCAMCAVNELHEMLGKLIAYHNDKNWITKAKKLYGKIDRIKEGNGFYGQHN